MLLSLLAVPNAGVFLNLLIAAIIVGAILYLFTLAPVDATIKQIVRVVVIVAFLIYCILLLARML